MTTIERLVASVGIGVVMTGLVWAGMRLWQVIHERRSGGGWLDDSDPGNFPGEASGHNGPATRAEEPALTSRGWPSDTATGRR